MPLAEHGNVRVVLTAGSAGLTLEPSDLSFVDGQSRPRMVCLPAISLPAGGEAMFWVAVDGSTYYGLSSQTQPDFSSLARQCQIDLPFVVTEPNFVLEVVAEGFQLPVNVAFVPAPGPLPEDPAFYVTELYGTVRVVSNDGTVTTYADDLLNFDPTGNFPGSGEQGLAGIVVDPETGDVFVTRVTDTDGLPGGASPASRSLFQSGWRSHGVQPNRDPGYGGRESGPIAPDFECLHWSGWETLCA